MECTCNNKLTDPLHYVGKDAEVIQPHTCPFAEEIHGRTDLCNCCEECTYQCAMDI